MPSSTPLSPPTWRVLGLGVASMFSLLGVAAMVKPRELAPGLGINVDSSTANNVVPISMALLGARDLSIAAMLFLLDYYCESKAMGLVITSCSILCLADLVAVYLAQGPSAWFCAMAAGASSWMWIGYRLVRG